MRLAIITGCAGLIGSAVTRLLDRRGWRTIGVDNNQRKAFFGSSGDTEPHLQSLIYGTHHFQYVCMDIRDETAIFDLLQSTKPDTIVHCAGQPSHDLASQIPLEDFAINAQATLSLLEATRCFAPEASFIFLSTNKVYGNRPNLLPLTELETRWEYADEADYHGINESCSIDQSLHSVFGASKLAADIMVQEYGFYFGIPTVCLRPSCITGAHHAGVELHGFLNYLVKAIVQNIPYTIYGYKGKQVRDQLHADDLAEAIYCCIERPRPGAVYNIGGGRANSTSILECIDHIESVTTQKLSYTYQGEPRRGDHICYISDTHRFQQDYPEWRISKSLSEIIAEIVAYYRQ